MPNLVLSCTSSSEAAFPSLHYRSPFQGGHTMVQRLHLGGQRYRTRASYNLPCPR